MMSYVTHLFLFIWRWFFLTGNVSFIYFRRSVLKTFISLYLNIFLKLHLVCYKLKFFVKTKNYTLFFFFVVVVVAVIACLFLSRYAYSRAFFSPFFHFLIVSLHKSNKFTYYPVNFIEAKVKFFYEKESQAY